MGTDYVIWERILLSVGTDYNLWERITNSVGTGHVICGNRLQNLWKQVI